MATESKIEADLGPEGPVLKEELLLLAAWYCPYAQRAWICLLEKGIPFRYLETNIVAPKSYWFLQLNPHGTVPTLAYSEDGTVHSIYESLICNEFLDEYAPEPTMLPPHPAERARARIIMDRFSSKFVSHWYGLLKAQDKESQDAVAAKMKDELAWLESQADPNGPFFMGTTFSLVDCALLPWFIRLYITKHHRGFELPAECVRLAAWYQNSVSRSSVQETMKVEEGKDYQELLLRTYDKYVTPKP